jgi:hypothetical protein
MNDEALQELQKADHAVQKLRVRIWELEDQIAFWEAKVEERWIRSQQLDRFRERECAATAMLNARKRVMKLEDALSSLREQLAKQTIILATLRIKNKNPI